MDDDLRNLAATVGQLLRDRGSTLSVAESCTGGLILSLLTDIAGSSDYLEGGLVTYSNEAKEQHLGVRHETLERHGAVSAETVQEMARGVRRAMRTDVGLAVTGIAGPGGGTAEKPVGLVFVGLATPEGERCERHVWNGDRLTNKQLTARAALQLLIDHLSQAADSHP